MGRLFALQDWWAAFCRSGLQVQTVSTAYAEVGLPDDVVAQLTASMDFLELMRLMIASKSWKRLLDNEEDWRRRWLAGKYTLNHASLSRCPTWKSRVALALRARRNMELRRGLSHVITKHDPTKANYRSDRSDYETIRPAVPGNFIGYVVVQNYDTGSRSFTYYKDGEVLDLRHWPSRTARKLKVAERKRKLCHIMVGTQFCVETLHGTSLDAASLFSRAKEGEKEQAHRPLRTKAPDGALANSDSAFPWLLMTSPGSTGNMSVGITIFDVESRKPLLTQNLAVDAGNGHFTPRGFCGEHLLIKSAGVWLYMKYDSSLNTIVFQKSINSAVDFLLGDLAPVGRGIHDTFFPCIDGGYFFVSPLASSPKLFFCELAAISTLPQDELETLLKQNCINVNVGCEIKRIRATRSLVACGSAYRSAIIDLESRRILTVVNSSSATQDMFWIDDTLLAIQQTLQTQVIDFVGRSVDVGLDNRTPPPLPTYEFLISILRLDPLLHTTQIETHPVAIGGVASILTAVFGANWSDVTTLTRYNGGGPDRIHDAAVRPVTFVIAKSSKQPRADEIVGLIDTAPPSSRLSWTSEEESLHQVISGPSRERDRDRRRGPAPPAAPSGPILPECRLDRDILAVCFTGDAPRGPAEREWQFYAPSLDWLREAFQKALDRG